MNDLLQIPCMLFRAGTSKGVCLLAEHLPKDVKQRNNLILRMMGSPHIRQIDGIGGATFTTSKVAIISKSDRVGIDVDYKFLQVGIDKAIIDDQPTCGNVLTAVGVYSLENQLLNAQDGQTQVNIFDCNTSAIIKQIIHTPNKVITYKGDFSIAGVPGTAAPIEIYFTNIAGGKTGKYLPTGSVINVIDNISVTCIDISMPTIFINATELGCSGYETIKELELKNGLIARLEHIRNQASQLMGLGDATNNVIPKIALISPPSNSDADINIRYFTPLSCHPAIAISAGFCLATGCYIKGTIINQITNFDFAVGKHLVRIENPSGISNIEIDFPTNDINEIRGYTKRTARILFSGVVYV